MTKFIFLTLSLICISTQATSFTYERWTPSPGGSVVTLRQTTQPNAVAEILFQNTSGDSGYRVVYTIDMQEIEIEVLLGSSDPDSIWITPPSGYIAIPSEATIEDGTEIILYIYPINALGM
jgi:hypothetical protein